MTSANDVLTIARSQLGYSSTPTRSIFNTWYGMAGHWCAMFVSWVAWKAGATSIIPRHAWTPSGAAWFKQRGQWHYGAKGLRPGDIVYFHFGGSMINHVGIFEGWRNGLVVTIDGNTGHSSQGAGGNVMRRARSTVYIAGYGRPAYANANTPAKRTGVLEVDGYWGYQTTSALQRINRTPIDGIVSGQAFKPEPCPAWEIGKGGSTLIRAMQRTFKVSQDGIVGTQTIKAMQRYYHTPVDGILSGGGQSTVIRAMQTAINHQLAK